MDVKIRCAACGRFFILNPRVKNQRYCSNRPCQRARKSRWQKQKLATDPDYKQNQRDSQQLWCSKNRGYWSDYRRLHGNSTDRNRTLQKIRDSRRRQLGSHLAKMDASQSNLPVKQGTYYLVPETVSRLLGLAKMDAFAQKICLFPVSYGANTVAAQYLAK